MPELPEVETTRSGLAPYIVAQQVKQVTVRNPNLRYPIPRRLSSVLTGQVIVDISRRGKYLLFKTNVGTMIMHLGMSGSLRIVDSESAYEKHDHLSIGFATGKSMRLRDPRRFGLALWTRKDPQQHKLLRDLGPEPLTDEFKGEDLYQLSRGRKLAIKQFIMHSHTVVGVGNIYANEALFMAGIHPSRAAGRISLHRYQRLVEMIKQVLKDAIAQGGTTLRDFVHDDGKPGYFKQQLQVYARVSQSCMVCNTAITHVQLGQRATYYCSHCQR